MNLLLPALPKQLWTPALDLCAVDLGRRELRISNGRQNGGNGNKKSTKNGGEQREFDTRYSSIEFLRGYDRKDELFEYGPGAARPGRTKLGSKREY